MYYRGKRSIFISNILESWCMHSWGGDSLMKTGMHISVPWAGRRSIGGPKSGLKPGRGTPVPGDEAAGRDGVLCPGGYQGSHNTIRSSNSSSCYCASYLGGHCLLGWTPATWIGPGGPERVWRLGTPVALLTPGPLVVPTNSTWAMLSIFRGWTLHNSGYHIFPLCWHQTPKLFVGCFFSFSPHSGYFVFFGLIPGFIITQRIKVVFMSKAFQGVSKDLAILEDTSHSVVSVWQYLATVSCRCDCCFTACGVNSKKLILPSYFPTNMPAW